MLDFCDNTNVHVAWCTPKYLKIFVDKLFFVLVCEDICVVLCSCLLVICVWRWVLYGVVCPSEVGVVWSGVSFWGGCCMEWCVLLRWVLYGVVCPSLELYSWTLNTVITLMNYWIKTWGWTLNIFSGALTHRSWTVQFNVCLWVTGGLHLCVSVTLSCVVVRLGVEVV